MSTKTRDKPSVESIQNKISSNIELISGGEKGITRFIVECIAGMFRSEHCSKQESAVIMLDLLDWLILNEYKG
jgi:hypothetical protein